MARRGGEGFCHAGYSWCVACLSYKFPEIPGIAVRREMRSVWLWSFLLRSLLYCICPSRSSQGVETNLTHILTGESGCPRRARIASEMSQTCAGKHDSRQKKQRCRAEVDFFKQKVPAVCFVSPTPFRDSPPLRRVIEYRRGPLPRRPCPAESMVLSKRGRLTPPRWGQIARLIGLSSSGFECVGGLLRRYPGLPSFPECLRPWWQRPEHSC